MKSPVQKKSENAIDLNGKGINAKKAEEIAEDLKARTHLEELYLGQNNIGDQGAIAIMESIKTHPDLHSLGLGYNGISYDGISKIAEFLKDTSLFPSLYFLNLSGNNVGNRGLEIIADALMYNNSLTSIDLRENQVTNVESLCQTLEQNHNITVIVLGNYNILSLGQMNELLKRNKQEQQSFIEAAKKGDLEKLKQLYSDPQLFFNKRARNHQIKVLEAAIENQQIDIVEFFIESGFIFDETLLLFAQDVDNQQRLSQVTVKDEESSPTQSKSLTIQRNIQAKLYCDNLLAEDFDPNLNLNDFGEKILEYFYQIFRDALVTDDLTKLAALKKISGLRGIKIEFDRPIKFNDRLRNPISLCKKDGKAYKFMRELQKSMELESTTGGPSSESSVAGGYRDLMQPFLRSPSRAASSNYDRSDLEALTILNTPQSKSSDKKSFSPDLSTKSPEEAKDQFLIPHFRGVNFNRKYFSKSARRKFGRKIHAGKAIHSLTSFENAGLLQNLVEDLTSEQEQKLSSLDTKIHRLFNTKLQEERQDGYRQLYSDKKRVFKFARDRMQQRYTNLRNKPITDIWEGVSILVNNTEYQDLILRNNPYISTGKTPDHAIRYALGLSVLQENKVQRADPRYRTKSAQAKYRLIGILYITLHTIDEYNQANPGDITRLHKKDEIGAHVNYLNENEVSFTGGIEGKNVVVTLPILYPSFRKEWEEYYLQMYGLSKAWYDNFKKRLSETKRHSSKHKAVKNEIRNHLIDHYSKIALELARKEAARLGKKLAYVNPDGEVEKYDKAENTKIAQKAKRSSEKKDQSPKTWEEVTKPVDKFSDQDDEMDELTANVARALVFEDEDQKTPDIKKETGQGENITSAENRLGLTPTLSLWDHTLSVLDEDQKMLLNLYAADKIRTSQAVYGSDQQTIDIYQADHDKPIVILSSVAYLLDVSNDDHPFTLEKRFRADRQIEECRDVFLINNRNNIHWDISLKDKEGDPRFFSSSGAGNSCAAYSILNIIKHSMQLLEDPAVQAIFDTPGVWSSQALQELPDVNSLSSDQVRAFLKCAITNNKAKLLEHKIPESNIKQSLARIDQIGVMLESDDIYYTCLALNIPVIESHSLMPQLDHEATIKNNIIKNLAKQAEQKTEERFAEERGELEHFAGSIQPPPTLSVPDLLTKFEGLFALPDEKIKESAANREQAKPTAKPITLRQEQAESEDCKAGLPLPPPSNSPSTKPLENTETHSR